MSRPHPRTAHRHLADGDDQPIGQCTGREGMVGVSLAVRRERLAVYRGPPSATQPRQQADGEAGLAGG